MAGAHWLDALTPLLEYHLQRLTESIAALLGTADSPSAYAPPITYQLAAAETHRQLAGHKREHMHQPSAAADKDDHPVAYPLSSRLMGKVLPGEELLFVSGIHPMILARAWFLAFLSIIFVFLIFIFTNNYILHIVSLSLPIFAAAYVLTMRARQTKTQFAVTILRVMWTKHIFLLSHVEFEINLRVIERIDIDQTIFGRKYNYGTIFLSSQNGIIGEPIYYLHDALAAQSAITGRRS